MRLVDLPQAILRRSDGCISTCKYKYNVKNEYCTILSANVKKEGLEIAENVKGYEIIKKKNSIINNTYIIIS